MNSIIQLLENIPNLPTPDHLKVKLKKSRDSVPKDRVLYVHYHADDGMPFYVGYGTIARPKQKGKNDRNADWHTVHNAHGVRVEILLTNLHGYVAIIMEKWLIHNYIQKYGRFQDGGLMTNRSTGGHGASGWKDTEETKKRKSYAAKIAKTGKLGETHNSFQGYSVGVNDKIVVIFSGKTEMNKFGFNASAIYSCISGRHGFKSHKGFKWVKMITINPDDFAGLEPYNDLSAERLKTNNT